MLLTLDINQMAEPIVKETKHNSFFLGMLFFVKKNVLRKLNRKLDTFILTLEGSFQHIEELDIEKASILLNNTKKIINDFYLIDENLKEDNYLGDEKLSAKFQYLLRTLYKFESTLHKITYKDTPVLKTPNEILNGISKINIQNLSKFTS